MAKGYKLCVFNNYNNSKELCYSFEMNFVQWVNMREDTSFSIMYFYYVVLYFTFLKASMIK